MPLKITHRKEEDVPAAAAGGKSNEELDQLRSEMSKVAAGMVLEIETGSAKAIRGTKGAITRASKQLGKPFIHWHQGTKVFAKPTEAPKRRGRPPKVQS